jgi:type VI secretion system secreted protein Hcp
MLKIGYLTINSERQGTVQGPSTYKLAPDTIEILQVKHEVAHDYNAQHGSTDGDRKHNPFVVLKSIDMASPILNEICCNAERILDMTLQYYVQDGQSPDPVPFFSWKLTNAYVISVKPVSARDYGSDIDTSYDLLEEVAFSYQHIEWHHYAHRAPSGVKDLPDIIQTDSWSELAGA